ncbi:hypothetical protein [Arthrobacter silvisoli]|uniref:hypothetical protein n=1 Tax=Arthrobacter silvisoli TaxID=2291022 RepID=UPI000E216031|nr:hypothetical protein [Arthrobacter silvisoli]
MSQEQPPIRSRRELRRAREQHLEQTPLEHVAGTGKPAEAPKKSGPETGRVRRVADAPVDATPSERSSQIRARDRAALRAIKELADKEGQLSKGGPPTRRQLRLQQLQEELAPGTSMLPVVAPPAGSAAVGSASADAPPSAIPLVQQAVPGGRSAQPGPYRTAPDGAIRVTAGPPVSAAEPAPAEAPAARPEMSVEQALAARELLTAQARNQANKLEHIASLENASGEAADAQAAGEVPEDQQALARQIAEAEREAILSKRAEAKQKLAEQTARPAAAKSGPATANNLAMVTPLEFVKVPGVERPMMKPPATSFVPLVTSAGPKLSKDQATAAKQRSKRGRSAVLARAEAAAKAPRTRTVEDAAVDSEGASPAAPVSARAAYGLDPLDAATAGLARARRQQLLILCLAVVAAAAVIAGIVFIASGISR